MNSTTIHFMLGIKNVYALLLICVTHLGCSSNFRYQMEKERGDVDRPSSSKRARISSVYEDSGNIQLMHKVNRLLEKEEEEEEEEKMRKVFEKGSPVTNEEIKSVVDRLNRTLDMFDIDSIDKEYKTFLNIYGSIDGGGFDIYGPSKCISDSENKIQEMLLIQKGFENRCRISNMKVEKVKSCWLIAGIDQGDEYYINLSGKNKENIYSMSPDGKSKIFAKDFLEFLDKFFEAYERKSCESDESE